MSTGKILLVVYDQYITYRKRPVENDHASA